MTGLWPIRDHLVALVLACVLPLLVIGGWLVRDQARDRQIEVERDLAFNAATIGLALDQELRRESVLAGLGPVEKAEEENLALDASIRPADLSRFLAERFSESPLLITAIDGDGRILAQVPDTDKFIGSRLGGWFRDAAGRQPAGIVMGSSPWNEPYVFAFHKSAISDLSLMVGLPQKAILAPVRLATGRLLLFAVLALAVSTGAALIFARRLTKGMNQLSVASRSVLSGEPIGLGGNLPVREMDELWRAIEKTGSELMLSRTRYKALIDNFPGAVFRLRMEPDGRRRLLFASDGYRELLGYEPEMMVAGGFELLRSLVHPDDFERLTASRLERWQKGLRNEAVWRVRHKDGSWRWMQEFTRPIGRDGECYLVDGYLRDVSGEMEARAALESQRQEMARILASLDLAGDGIVVTSVEMKILYVNRAFALLCGLDDDSRLIGRSWRELAADGLVDGETVATISARGRATGQWDGDLPIIRPADGRRLHFNIRFRVMPDGSSVVMLTDITERIEKAEEQRDLERQLQQSRKLEALGQLAGGIAHDFNNLLGAILGFAHFILDDMPADSASHRHAGRIVAASLRARALIGQILAFSRRRELTRSRFPLASVIEETGEFLRATLPATTRFSVVNRASGTHVEADRGQLTQVLMNLSINGNDALCGETGLLSIEIGPADLTPALQDRLFGRSRPEDGAAPIVWEADDGSGWVGCGRLDPRRDYVSLAVIDSGCGMDKNTLEKLFEPFFTTKGQGRGTGLGLAVVHGIVLEHDGVIVIRTVKGQGTRFEILLPASGHAESPAPPSGEAPTPPARKGRILVVDDSLEFGDMLTIFLERQGHEVAALCDPEEALAILKEEPSAFDLMVTDQTMPNMKGTALVEAARLLCPTMIAIICTGFSSGLTEEIAHRHGAAALIGKPIDLPDFARLVERLLERKPPLTEQAT